MSDQQSTITSSVAPGDSVSSRGGRKAKPGKAERAAKRAGQGGVPGSPASATKAAAFASAPSIDPTPMPGRYPVVFNTGAGEPSRDETFVYDHLAISRFLPEFKDRYVKNPKYNEFKAHSGLTDAQFGCYTNAAFLLGLAQQTVHAHVNMGLPLLDYSPVNSSDLQLPLAMRAVIGQYGEYSVPTTGTRYLLSDYRATVDRYVLAAQQIYNGGTPFRVLERLWLPTRSDDPVSKAYIANQLNEFLNNSDIAITPTVLEEAVLSGEIPDAWEAIKPLLGDPPAEGQPDERDRFDFIFRAYADVGQFTTAWTTQAAAAARDELGLAWFTPQAGHLNWQFSTKSVFADLVDRWSRVATAYGQFFEMGSSQANRSSASGSQAQLVDVNTVAEVTIVKAVFALSAPAFSLAACFPPECVLSNAQRRNVVVTTPVNVSQRVTEFLQGDWR